MRTFSIRKGEIKMLQSGFITAKGSTEFWMTKSANGNYKLSIEPDGKESFTIVFHKETEVINFIDTFDESELN
jgi:hypothetical protein